MLACAWQKTVGVLQIPWHVSLRHLPSPCGPRVLGNMWLGGRELMIIERQVSAALDGGAVSAG